MGEKRCRIVDFVELLDDDSDYALCTGSDFGKSHTTLEFQLVLLRRSHARAGNCPRCGGRFVSFVSTAPGLI